MMINVQCCNITSQNLRLIQLGKAKGNGIGGK